MTPRVPVADHRLPRLLGCALGALVLVGGAVSFSGWAFNVPRLTDWFNDGISIQPNPSVLMMLAGAGVILSHTGARRTALALGAVIATVGALTLLQYIVGADFGFNHQLLFGREWGQASTLTRGRMGPPASSAFVLIGSAIVLLALGSRRPRLRRFVPALGLGVCVITLFSLIGYIYNARTFYALPWVSAIAQQTSLMLAALAVGVIASVPDRDPMRMLREESAARFIARVLLPLLIILPVLFTLLRVHGQELGLYDRGTGRALSSIALIVVTLVLLWWALVAVRNRELREREARRLLYEQTELLREADRRKDEFIAILGHELRNPLTVVFNAAQLLQLPAKDIENHGDITRMLQEQTKHLVRLVDDLLDVSRVTRGKVTLRTARVSLGEVIRQAVDAIQAAVAARSQSLRLSIPDGPLEVIGDETRLVQVVSNLLSNASKFTPTAGRIDVTVSRDGRAIVTSVRDTGCGMEPRTLQNIFYPFYQASGGRGGLGIGLALVKTLVEMHGGSVQANSDGLGRGSEVIIRLPAAEADHQPAAPSLSRHATGV